MSFLENPSLFHTCFVCLYPLEHYEPQRCGGKQILLKEVRHHIRVNIILLWVLHLFLPLAGCSEQPVTGEAGTILYQYLSCQTVTVCFRTLEILKLYRLEFLYNEPNADPLMRFHLKCTTFNLKVKNESQRHCWCSYSFGGSIHTSSRKSHLLRMRITSPNHNHFRVRQIPKWFDWDRKKSTSGSKFITPLLGCCLSSLSKEAWMMTSD